MVGKEIARTDDRAPSGLRLWRPQATPRSTVREHCCNALVMVSQRLASVIKRRTPIAGPGPARTEERTD